MKAPSSRRTFLTSIITSAVGSGLLSRQAFALEGEFIKVCDALGTASLGTPFRDRYLLGDGITFLNHASIGTVPRAVNEAHGEYTSLCETNPWLYMWGGAWTEGVEEARELLAALVGRSNEDVAILHNTTEAFNLLAQGLPLGRGDEVLFSSLNHASASTCWHHFGNRHGYRVRTFNVPLDQVSSMTPSEFVDLHLAAVGAATRVVVLPHVDNMVGIRAPLAELSEALKAAGVEYVLVDGAQSLGMVNTDLSDTSVDAFGASTHKWIQSPKGLGTIAVTPTTRAFLSAMWVKRPQNQWGGHARAYEDYSTRNLPEVLALGDALRFQAAIPSGSREAHHRQLFEHLQTRVSETTLRWDSPTSFDFGSAVMAVGLSQGAANEVSRRLAQERGVFLRPFSVDGREWIRVSPNVANSIADLDNLIDTLEAWGYA